MIPPLKESLSDDDPYVRKTAVLTVPKVYEINAEMVESSGILQIMQKMLGKEDNAYVISNLVMALVEISEIKLETPSSLTRLEERTSSWLTQEY